jgi:hypothetical protein
MSCTLSLKNAAIAAAASAVNQTKKKMFTGFFA